MALADYAAARGNIQVPPDLRTADGFPLGRWVAEQRLSHLEGRFDYTQVIAPEQIPTWVWGHTTHWLS